MAASMRADFYFLLGNRMFKRGINQVKFIAITEGMVSTDVTVGLLYTDVV
jgi:hypothetical protein